MPTSRTATTTWRKTATQAKTQARTKGQTTCPLCGAWLTWDTPNQPTTPEADHITPHAQGGTDDPHNIRILCRTCNRTLGGKTGATRRKPHREPPTINLPTTINW